MVPAIIHTHVGTQYVKRAGALYTTRVPLGRGGSRICEKGGGGGGRESKFLDATPKNNKNRPKKRGAVADSAPPPPPWIRHCP